MPDRQRVAGNACPTIRKLPWNQDVRKAKTIQWIPFAQLVGALALNLKDYLLRLLWSVGSDSWILMVVLVCQAGIQRE